MCKTCKFMPSQDKNYCVLHDMVFPQSVVDVGCQNYTPNEGFTR